MDILHKKTVLTACILAASCIAIGAFGAHGLKQIVSQDSLAIYVTGTHYHMYHALALLVLGCLPQISSKTRATVFWFFLLGTVFFSGSLYVLALKNVLPFNVSFLGPITPLGGLLFILGWLRLGYGVVKK
ncbi:DUF423 domain-containing protein [Patiriisocius marinus]|uniref:Membrane protein n=1 Tax=Patiriisocius marinus TaxID=1397112 RepID=A0A5J4IR21_9FLAO|nr:DUF423 domain-containing protein [Patiriisocius marinus]GER60365.1 membrane protein [Patiriisocius marinus]